MAVSMRDLDPAFQGVGQKAGLEIWRIESFNPVPVPKSSYGKFFTGDSYVILKTVTLKSGALRHDIHYWLGKDTSQDEAGTAAIKTVELDAALGGRAVQYREVQGHETEKFLSYFRPCIIPQEGGVASGFKHFEAEEHKTRLFVCKGKHVVHVKEVPFARSSLNHDDIFILDTKSKIFQFNGSNSSIQERAKALEVVQYIKDTYHDGKCEVAAIEDGRLMADSESGEFWGFFGGFAPLPKKSAINNEKNLDSQPAKLLCIEKGESKPVEADLLTRELLDSNKCYILDAGIEVFVWMGRNTALDERKSASRAAEELVSGPERSKSQMIRVIEGFETVMFRSKFDSWHQTTNATEPDDGKGKVAALLKRQGVNVKGLVRSDPVKEEPQPCIDCTGNLQVWRVNGKEKVLLPASDQSKLYSGDCYIFMYSYPGEDKEEYLIGTWFGKQSVEEDRASAVSLASKMVESMKFVPVQARIYEGHEPIQFYSIFQSIIAFKGGLSDGYKGYIAEKEVPDETYQEDGVALFRVQGSGPDNMQAIQVDLVASSLNSSHCYILHDGSTLFTWSGGLTSSDDQELMERLLDVIKPNVQTKPQKEGAESEKFWELLGGKSEYSSQKIGRDVENDPHLFSCSFRDGNLKVTEIYNFTQDDLMTEDIFILDCHSNIFVWVGQQVDSKNRQQALTIGERFLEGDFLLEKISQEAPIYVIMEGNEPPFFTRFFTWDWAKFAMHGNSFQRRLILVKNGGTPAIDVEISEQKMAKNNTQRLETMEEVIGRMQDDHDKLGREVGGLREDIHTLTQQISLRFEQIIKLHEDDHCQSTISSEKAKEAQVGTSISNYHIGSSHGIGETNNNVNQRNDFRFCKMYMPLFDGHNSDGWIMKVERYFAFHRINMEEKLEAAIVSFDGDVLLWFQWENKRNFATWEEMKLLFLRQFCTTQNGTIHEQWLALVQEGTVRDYQRKFIELSAPLENIPEEIALGNFINGLKAEIKVELRILGPNNLGRAIDLAQMIEEKLNLTQL